MESNNSSFINTIITTVVIGWAVTFIALPQINIFAPSDNPRNTEIQVDSSSHNTAPVVDASEILKIVNEQSVLPVQNPPQQDVKKQPEKRVKQPGTYYRCVNPITGKPIEHGKSVIVYEKSLVTFPETCKQETRVCDNGTMLWSYVETSCQRVWDGCVWPDGKNYSHGAVGTYYLHNEVIGKPEDGEDICTRQARVCQGGSRYLFDRQTKSNFDYKYSYCNAKIQ